MVVAFILFCAEFAKAIQATTCMLKTLMDNRLRRGCNIMILIITQKYNCYNIREVALLVVSGAVHYGNEFEGA